MTDAFQLAPETITRLQKHAKPFVDTVDSVVNRLIDAYESSYGEPISAPQTGASQAIRDFDPITPPNLTHTKLLSATFNGTKLSPADTTWNSLLIEAIRVVKRKAPSNEQLNRLILVNYVVGKKEVDGYKYVEDIELSIQGQDANSAWRAIFHIARQYGCAFEVIFSWRPKEEAQFPGVTGRFAGSPVRRI